MSLITMAALIGGYFLSGTEAVDQLRFMARKSDYVAELGQRTVAVFPWMEEGALGGGVRFKGIVFDVQGQVAKRPEERSEAWIRGLSGNMPNFYCLCWGP
jgi:hypothetical protein